MADKNGTIDVFSVIAQIETNHINDSQAPLLVNILKRLYNFNELWGGSKIDFDQFLASIKKAMNMRQTKKQVDQLFEVFVPVDHGNLLKPVHLR